MAAIDTVREITAEVPALESMAYGLDPNSVDEDLGMGLGRLLDHIRKDLLALEKEVQEEKA
jgi:hypothetical protein